MKNITIEITDICPLACQHCSTYNAWDRNDILISLGEFKHFLKENSQYKEVRLSGGEPFMHPNIIEFAQEAKHRSHVVNILSCGVYREVNDYRAISEEIIQKCKGLVDHISLSLHGSKETHERVVKVPDTFEYLDKTINRIIRARIPFSFGFVPIRTNHHDLEEAVQYASTKAKQQNYCTPNLHLLRYVKQGGNQYICDDSDIRERLALSQEENLKIIEEGKQLEKKYNFPIIVTCSMLEKGCTAGREKKVITVYGHVCGCSALKWDLAQTSVKKQVACVGRH